MSAATTTPLTRQCLPRDPLRSNGDESPYQYCAGNPVIAYDPWGLMNPYQ